MRDNKVINKEEIRDNNIYNNKIILKEIIWTNRAIMVIINSPILIKINFKIKEIRKAKMEVVYLRLRN